MRTARTLAKANIARPTEDEQKCRYGIRLTRYSWLAIPGLRNRNVMRSDSPMAR